MLYKTDRLFIFVWIIDYSEGWEKLWENFCFKYEILEFCFILWDIIREKFGNSCANARSWVLFSRSILLCRLMNDFHGSVFNPWKRLAMFGKDVWNIASNGFLAIHCLLVSKLNLIASDMQGVGKIHL